MKRLLLSLFSFILFIINVQAQFSSNSEEFFIYKLTHYMSHDGVKDIIEDPDSKYHGYLIVYNFNGRISYVEIDRQKLISRGWEWYKNKARNARRTNGNDWLFKYDNRLSSNTDVVYSDYSVGFALSFSKDLSRMVNWTIDRTTDDSDEFFIRTTVDKLLPKKNQFFNE